MRSSKSLMLVTSLALLGLTLLAHAQDGSETGPTEQPPGTPPAQPPPSIPPAPPPPTDPGGSTATSVASEPLEPAEPVPAPTGQAGQWVDTAQYGWLWVPYGPAYNYAPAYGVAYSYAYYPSNGWRWISAPWVWGIGTRPFFSVGPRYYGWYRPRYWGPGYRWGNYYGGYGRAWVAPPYRAGVGYGVGFHGGPVYRGTMTRVVAPRPGRHEGGGSRVVAPPLRGGGHHRAGHR